MVELIAKGSREPQVAPLPAGTMTILLGAGRR
jgi:hypothetical protein